MVAGSTGWTSVVEVFAARRAERPDAVAVTGEFGVLSYAELGALADAVAARISDGVTEEETCVGYLGPRDQRFTAALLGILGSGAAYVPLDPSWPATRIAEVAEESGMDRVLVDQEHAGLAADAGLSTLIDIDEALAPVDTPGPRVKWSGTGRELAYVVFTSGSTGRPKGVLTEHAALWNNVAGMAARWELTKDDRVLQFTPLGVDITLEEAFTAWTAGAALVLMRPETATDLALFTAFLAEHRVTALDLPTSFWVTWLTAIEAADVPAPPATARVVAVGSEEVDTADIARWHAVAGPHSRVFNMYGSTEQAITSIVHGPLAPGDHLGAGVIGTPLPGVRAYVLDDALEPVAPHTAGELYVGGAAVARGYIGQSARTAARFLPDPYAGVPGARMYATGDRAVALADGAFRFAGRIDDRLKIRGFTVQPREVEGVLAAVDGVVRATVRAEAGPDGRDRVLAEVSTDLSKRELAGLVTALAQAVTDQLPAPAHPQRYLVDAPGLSEPRAMRPSGHSVTAASRAPGAEDGQGAGSAGRRAAAEAVTALWQELLGPQDVGPHDSFLDLGGNSLMITQLLTRLRSRFDVELDYAAFFAAPTVATVADAVVAAGAYPADAAAGDVARHIPRTDAASGPCWPGQERMWFLQRSAPGSAVYNLPLVFEVDGELDRAALETALRTVVTRHEPLRTAIRFEDGRLVQVVRPPQVRIETMRAAGTRRQELHAADGALAAFVARPFDLAVGDMLRTLLLDCEGDGRLLAFVVHHAAFDEWSAGLFVTELTEAYGAALRGAEARLPELSLRYLDFSTWRADAGFAGRDARLREFWRDYLHGMPTELALPTDREPPRKPTGTGAAKAFTVPSRHTAGLGALAQREGVTRYHALLTLFSVFLARHAGQYDFAVGVPTADRGSEELERLIGLFVNTLPVRVSLDDNPRFAEAVQRLSKSTLKAQAAGDLPLDEIARTAGVHSTGGRNPIFQTMFLMDEERIAPQNLPGAELRPVEVPARTSTLDLTLILGEHDGLLEGRLWYSTERFDEESAHRLVETFLALVERVVADPDMRVKDLAFVPVGGRALASGPAPAAAAERLPPALRIAEAARAHPDRPAVTDGARTFTYAELLRLVDDLRARLLAAGPGPFVPLLLPSGVPLLASMIAVNSIGSAFVPLDPEWPEQRIADILDEVGCRYAVVPEGMEAVPGGGGRVAVPAPAGPTGDRAPTPWQLTGDDTGRPMYAVYTSGSTGRPKGAIVHHLGVANRIAWMNRVFGADAAACVLQTTPPVYDSCVWEYLWPLTAGGRTVLSGPRLQADPAGLLDLIAAHGVRVADLVPSMLDGLVRHAAADPAGVAALRSLDVVIAGGEELGREVARRFEDLGLTARLYNLYGPTEASIGSMFHRVTGGDRGRVLIGRPIDGTGAAVLDERRQVVPYNVVGELYLAGDCVGLGYLGNASQTRRRFVGNRFGEALPGTRLYRTGDLARMRPTGEVEFWGRADDQIKIRGVRVEPGEVAAALEAHDAVREAAVVAASRPVDAERLRHRVEALLAAASPELAAAALLKVTGTDRTPGHRAVAEQEG